MVHLLTLTQNYHLLDLEFQLFLGGNNFSPAGSNTMLRKEE